MSQAQPQAQLSGEEAAAVGAITAEWLTSALSERNPGVVVEGFDVVETMIDSGVKLFVVVRYAEGTQGGLPDKLVIKAGFGHRESISQFTFDVEAIAYRYLVDHVEVDKAACFYAGPGPKGVGATVILENLRERDVRFCHAASPLDLPTVKRFVDGLASLHAMSWNKVTEFPGYEEWAKDVTSLQAARAAYHLYISDDKQWDFYQSLPRGMASPRILRDRSTILAARARLAEHEKGFARCITHGDEHLGNFYIQANGEPGFFDWQSRVAPWAQSLTYFLGSALDIVDRRNWEIEVLKHYLDRLAAYGAAAPSFEDAWLAYRQELLWGYWVWLMNSPDYQSEAVNTTNCMRFAVAMLDHDTLGLINNS